MVSIRTVTAPYPRRPPPGRCCMKTHCEWRGVARISRDPVVSHSSADASVRSSVVIEPPTQSRPTTDMAPVGRLHDAQARVREVAARGLTPLRIAITDEHPVVGEGLVVGEDERAGHADWRTALPTGHLHATARQIEDEEGGGGAQALGRPDVRGEAVGARNGAPMRPQEGLPGRGPCALTMRALVVRPTRWPTTVIAP